MLGCSVSANNAMPDECRIIAEELFPVCGYPEGRGPSLEQIRKFAGILGLGNDYKTPDAGSLLNSFQNNLDLLIQKTWVDKAEEIRKEKLLDRLPAFFTDIEQENFSEALKEFGTILDELAWLFFGAQSRKDDFTEYTLRIDTQIGLFWWYGNQLCNPQTLEWIKRTDRETLKAILFLGVCYLTNF
jgi:hypothetical protein